MKEERNKRIFSGLIAAAFLLAALFVFRMYSVRSYSSMKKHYQKKLEGIFRSFGYHGSYLLSKDGKILFSGGYGRISAEGKEKIGRDSSLPINSITKQFTGAAIFRLISEGKLSQDETLRRFFPDCSYADRVTVRQLLEMNSGIPNYTDDQDFLSRFSGGTGIVDTAELVDAILQFKLDGSTGGEFHYSNSNYVLLGAIIEKLSGQSYGDYIESEFLKPLGLSHTGSSAQDAEVKPYDGETKSDGEEYSSNFSFSAGGMSSNVIDLYEWQNALYKGGIPGVNPDEIFSDGKSYTMGLSKEGRVFHHSGAGKYCRSYIFYDEETDGQIILLSNRSNAELSKLAEKLYSFAKQYYVAERKLRHGIGGEEVRGDGKFRFLESSSTEQESAAEAPAQGVTAESPAQRGTTGAPAQGSAAEPPAQGGIEPSSEQGKAAKDMSPPSSLAAGEAKKTEKAEGAGN